MMIALVAFVMLMQIANVCIIKFCAFFNPRSVNSVHSTSFSVRPCEMDSTSVS